MKETAAQELDNLNTDTYGIIILFHLVIFNAFPRNIVCGND